MVNLVHVLMLIHNIFRYVQQEVTCSVRIFFVHFVFIFNQRLSIYFNLMFKYYSLHNQ